MILMSMLLTPPVKAARCRLVPSLDKRGSFLMPHIRLDESRNQYPARPPAPAASARTSSIDSTVASGHRSACRRKRCGRKARLKKSRAQQRAKKTNG
jgi:hypothetical protein